MFLDMHVHNNLKILKYRSNSLSSFSVVKLPVTYFSFRGSLKEKHLMWYIYISKEKGKILIS